MFDYIWNVRGYFFWLLAASVLCVVFERLWPWRREQKGLRRQLWQDIFFLFFNGHYFGLFFASAFAWGVGWVNTGLGLVNLPAPGTLNLLSAAPHWAQFLAYLVFRDFLEWLVHNLLHRVSFLWRFHRLHHSIVEMDFIGNFRFHWMETVVYQTLTWLPLVALGVDRAVLLPLAAATTLIGHLNHANVRFDYGPLRYILNSPRMHIWHHDINMHFKSGQNFGIVLSVFDWLFGTAYMPEDKEQPAALGFEKMDTFPDGLLGRLLYPLSLLWLRPRGAGSK